MRILHVTPYFKIGSMYTLHELIQNLSKLGLDIIVLTSGENDLIEYNNFTLIRCKRYFTIQTIPIWPKIVKYLLSIDYDIIHNHFTVPGSPDAACFLNRYLRKKPMISTVHSVLLKFSGFSRVLTNLYNKTWFNAILKSSQKIILPSKGFYEDNPLFIPCKRKIQIIPWGIDENLFKAQPIDAALLKKYPINEDQKILLYAGALLPTKGLMELIHALKLINQNENHYTLLIAGIGPFENVLKKEVQKLKLTNNVIFTGWVPRTEMPSLYSLADIYVQPSYSESFCMSILEAITCGTPVIASKKIGIREIVQNETGCLLESITPENIASAVLQFDLTKTRRIHNSRAEIIKKFNWNRIVRQIYNLYKELENNL